MKRLVLVAGIFAFSGSVLIAQEKTDAKAKTILDELSAKTRSYSTIKAEFSFNMENKDKKQNETQTGKVQIKGNKYKLEIKGQEIICDNKTIWTYLKDANEVQVNNVEINSGEDAINPSTIFTIYEKGFKYKFEKEEIQGAATIQVISLYPLNPDKKKYHTVKLMIDKGKKQITGIKTFMKDGSVFSYTIKNFTPNADINDAVFIFDTKLHKGVEVVDLRE